MSFDLPKGAQKWGAKVPVPFVPCLLSAARWNLKKI